MIEPKILKGFRDALPEDEAVKEEMIDILKGVFRQYGFVPIDTPCLEYSEVLLRKSNGETEKQVFRFSDNGGRDVALRFDLTVPLARYVAMHKDALYFPFKRYHISKVWRGEKPQGGRYREFTQCDFDTIGSMSAASDAEALLVMGDALCAVGAGGVEIHINHRGVLSRFLNYIGAGEREEEILRAIDRLHKAGEEKVRADLNEIAGKDKASKILQYISAKGTWEEVLEAMAEAAGGEGEDTKRLRDVYEILQTALMGDGKENVSYVLDASITRGLDYYTGVVFESFLMELPDIGSVCSGGRYDNLAGLYTKENISGVGASVGLDRLIAALEMLGKRGDNPCKMDVIVFADDKSGEAEREKAAMEMRRAGLKAEAYCEVQKMNKQYTMAERKGAVWGAFIEKDGITLKRLETRESTHFETTQDAIKCIIESAENRRGGK